MSKEAIEFIQKGICNLDRDERKEAYENFIQAITVLRAEEPKCKTCGYKWWEGELSEETDAQRYANWR